MKRRAATRRRTWAAFLLAALALLAAGCGSEVAEDPEPPRPAEGATDQPNIVIVMTDDQRAGEESQMPTVESLASKGTSYERFYASLPLCCPARATLLTGQYAHNHGVLSNKPPNGGYQAFRGRRDTLGRWLQRAGYRTGWIGKYMNGYGLRRPTEVPPGWDRWIVPPGFDDLLMYGYRLNVDGRIRRYGEQSADYQTDVLARFAREFVAESAGPEPFFLMVSTLAPHDERDVVAVGPRDPRPAPRHFERFTESTPPPSPAFNERDISDKPPAVARRPRLDREARRAIASERGDRLASLLAVDEALAALLRELRRAEETSDTVVIFTSDNGYMLGEHRLPNNKGVPYEESVRVPLVVKGPSFPANQTRAAPTANVDLIRTVTELAGAEPGRSLDGASLIDVAVDPGHGLDRAILLAGEGDSWLGIRTSRWTFVRRARGTNELYDNDSDPAQLQNLSGRDAVAGIERELDALLDDLSTCAGANCVQSFRDR